MYKADELWAQALNYRGALVTSSEIEQQVDSHGVIMRKHGYGYDFLTYHSGGEYFDKLTQQQINAIHRLGFEEGTKYVASELLKAKLERYEKRMKPNSPIIQSIKTKLCELNNQQQKG